MVNVVIMKKYQLVILVSLLVLLILVAGCNKKDKSQLDTLKESVGQPGVETALKTCTDTGQMNPAEPSILNCATAANCKEGGVATDLGVCEKEPIINCICPDNQVCIMAPGKQENIYFGACNFPPPPRAPFNLTASVLNIFNDTVRGLNVTNLTWKSNEGDKFNIYKNKNNDYFVNIASTSEKYYIDYTVFGKDIMYGYYVTALNRYGESNASNIVYVSLE